MTLFLELVAVAVLVLLNGFLSRRVRPRHRAPDEDGGAADAGNRRARQVLPLTAEPPRFIAAMQLGVTLTCLAIGALGESALRRGVRPRIVDARRRRSSRS